MWWRRTSWIAASVIATLVHVSALRSLAIDLRLPAIDPSGRRLFLPLSESTSLNVDKDRGLFQKDKDFLRGKWPEPAYQAPEVPPLCGSPQADLAVPITREEAAEIKPSSWLPNDKLLSKLAPPPASWLEDAQLQITPQRTVARVGTEVILVGGVCTDPGILIRGEVVEWYLDARGVGQFSDGGSQYFGPLHRLFYGRATYAEPDYVLSLGAPGRRVLTRGTTTETDDVLLQAGQSWVSLYSDQPGISYVTAYAPRVPNCELNRVQAIVQWVEGEWVFPTPTSARAGSSESLTTTVRRLQTGEPLAGWNVRYEILSGPGVFEGTENKTSTVVTAADGLATVRLKGPPDQSGTTRVAITVTQPAISGAEPIVVGRGETSIQWNSVELDVQLEGPPSAALDDEVTYRVTVRNLGSAPSPPLTLEDNLPVELQFIDSDPPATPWTQRLVWQLESIPAQGLRQVLIRARTTRIGRFQHCVQLVNALGGPRDSCITTEVNSPPLEIQVTGDATVAQGQRTTVRIALRNRGNQPLNVRLRSEFDRGLQHYDPVLNGPAPGSEGGLLVRDNFGTLAPGASLAADITFTALEPGSQCVRVTGDSEGVSATGQSCVTVTAPASVPEVRLRLEPTRNETGPLQVGGRREYRIVASNFGNVPLTNVVLDIEADGALEISHATAGNERTDWGTRWRIPRLEPGQTATWEVEVRAERASESACVQATIVTDQRVTDQQRDCPAIYLPGGSGGFGNNSGGLPLGNPPFNSPPGGTQPGGGISSGSNSLLIQSRTVSNSARINDLTTLYVTLISESSYEINDVAIEVNLPTGLSLVTSRGPGQAYDLGYRQENNGQLIKYENILSVRPGERLQLELQLRATALGPQDIQIQVTGEQLENVLTQQQRVLVTQ